jgi:hypothetical protein
MPSLPYTICIEQLHPLVHVGLAFLTVAGVRCDGDHGGLPLVQLGIFCGNLAADVAAFETFIGKPVDAVLGYTSEKNGYADADPGWQIGGGTGSGIYLGGSGRRINWSIPAWPESNGLEEMRSVSRGEQYARHQGWAKKCLDHRAGDSDPIYVRTAWELGGEWFPWTQNAKDDPAAFIGAFRQFTDAFRSQSSRFRMQWDIVPDRGEVTQWWPGDGWVDIISQDVYWHPQYDGSDAKAAFARHNTGLDRGLAWVKQYASGKGKGVAVPEWGAPGDRNDLAGDVFITEMRDWLRANNAVFADYWDSTSAYNGLLSDGSPTHTANALKQLYIDGITTTQPPPDPDPPTEQPAVTGGTMMMGWY